MDYPGVMERRYIDTGEQSDHRNLTHNIDYK